MKHFYLLFIIVILSSCSDFEMDEKFLSNTPTNKNRDDNISIDDLLGIWEGTDLMGNLAVFTVDSVSYHLAFKSTITMVSAKDVDIPPTISHKLESGRRQDIPDYGYYHEKPLTFHNPKVLIYANILSGKTNSIEYDGDMFYTRYIKNAVIRDILGTLYPEDSKLYITLTTGPRLTASAYTDFILTKKDQKKTNLNRPERDIINPPNTVYRRDTRDPSDIFANGFSPRGQNNDLIAHVSGISLYQQGVAPSGWVSTSSSLNWATNPTQPMPNEEFWLYVITPTPNAYGVIPSFQHFANNTINSSIRASVNQLITLFQEQQEWAFLGHIPSSNIRRAVRYHFRDGSYHQVEVRENPNYNRNVIPSGSPHPYTIFTSVPGFTNQFFRAESRTPEHIEESRGIIGDDNDDQTYLTWGENVEQMSLYLHSRSETRDSYGYISINNSLERAYIEGNRLFSRLQTSYIYVIAQAPNIFYTSNILGQFRNRENQFSAMGGIPISQIIGWYTVANGSISGPMTPNPSYRENQFSGLHIVDGAAGYTYAGFPLGHRAWLESPWRNFAPEYCKRWDRYPDLKRDVSLSWCEHNTDVRSKAKFKELKARLYTKNPNPR